MQKAEGKVTLSVCTTQEAPTDEPKTGAADGEATTPAQRSAISQEAAQQTLSKLLISWSKAQTVKAAHPSMLPEDQQRVLDWMLQHKDVTIFKFAKVIVMLYLHTVVSGSCVQQTKSFICGLSISLQLLQCCRGSRTLLVDRKRQLRFGLNTQLARKKLTSTVLWFLVEAPQNLTSKVCSAGQERAEGPGAARCQCQELGPGEAAGG